MRSHGYPFLHKGNISKLLIKFGIYSIQDMFNPRYIQSNIDPNPRYIQSNNTNFRRNLMTTREEVTLYCKSFPDVYEDYPFHDNNWALIRCTASKKSFAFIYEKDGHIWMNLKCDPQWVQFWRDAYPSVIPAYHMSKKSWNSIILDGTIPEDEIKRMIAESYDQVKGKPRFSIGFAKISDAPDVFEIMEEVHKNMEHQEFYVIEDYNYVSNHISENGFTVLSILDKIKIAGFLIVRFPKDEEYNLGTYMGLNDEELKQVAIMESAAVLPAFRGYSLQKKMLKFAEEQIKKSNQSDQSAGRKSKPRRYLMSTVAPQNAASLGSMEKLGYKIICQKTMYGGYDRYVMCKKI